LTQIKIAVSTTVLFGTLPHLISSNSCDQRDWMSCKLLLGLDVALARRQRANPSESIHALNSCTMCSGDVQPVGSGFEVAAHYHGVFTFGK
jgi:hypothetical protein